MIYVHFLLNHLLLHYLKLISKFEILWAASPDAAHFYSKNRTLCLDKPAFITNIKH